MNRIKSEASSRILSIEQIIDTIRSVRNDIIKDLLNEANLPTYFGSHFKKELSDIKQQFLRRDLSELLIAPVDLVHYAGLINQIKKTGSISLTEKDREYFYEELDRDLKKYSF